MGEDLLAECRQRGVVALTANREREGIVDGVPMGPGFGQGSRAQAVDERHPQTTSLGIAIRQRPRKCVENFALQSGAGAGRQLEASLGRAGVGWRRERRPARARERAEQSKRGALPIVDGDLKHAKAPRRRVLVGQKRGGPMFGERVEPPHGLLCLVGVPSVDPSGEGCGLSQRPRCSYLEPRGPALGARGEAWWFGVDPFQGIEALVHALQPAARRQAELARERVRRLADQCARRACRLAEGVAVEWR